MNRMLLGAFAALILVAVGVFWWQGRAIETVGAPLPDASATTNEPEALPSADISDVKGPELPTAERMTNEQRRFARYDLNRDLIITRNEMLSTRVAAFRKLDKDGNNLLDFEEWAVATTSRFDGADANSDGRLTAAEFATTAPKPGPKPVNHCKC